jgi:hypothetical protein
MKPKSGERTLLASVVLSSLQKEKEKDEKIGKQKKDSLYICT